VDKLLLERILRDRAELDRAELDRLEVNRAGLDRGAVDGIALGRCAPRGLQADKASLRAPSAPPRWASSLPRTLGRFWRSVVTSGGNDGPRQEALAKASVTPTCRLRLDGREAQEGVCDILELSSEGVTIAIRHARAGRRGQQGQLLIGPAGGDHYALPVAVRWVKPATTTTTVLGLSFPTAERWTYNRC